MIKNFYFIFASLVLISCNREKGRIEKQNGYLENLREEVKEHYSNKQYDSFFDLNNFYLIESNKQKDSFHIGNAFWNYGNYYYKLNIQDSAYVNYIRSFNIYSKIKNNDRAGKVLYNVSLILKDINDLTSSEINLYKTLTLIDDSNIRYKILAHNLLGLVYKKLQENKASIENFNKAIEYIEHSKNNNIYKKTIYNNLGLLYQQDEKYDLAIKNFNKALSLLDSNDIESKTRYLSNISFTKFLAGDTSFKIENELLSALENRMSNNFKSGISDSYINLSEFYIKTNRRDKAVEYALKSLKESKEINYFEDVLIAYNLLNELDSVNSNKYYTASIKLRDSLAKVDRAIRNKFTRIQYETDQYKEQSERLEASNNYLKIIMSLTTLSFVLVFLFFKQRSKNKQISLEREIENEKAELYKLSVESQTKLEEAKDDERRRISMELHDGVLSSIASIRISFGLIAKELFGKGVEIDDFNEYDSAIDSIQKEIRSLSHNLNNTHDSNLNFINLLKNSIVSLDNVKVYIKNSDDIHWEDVSDTIKSHLYRIIQESFKNTLKHAQATRFEVIFSYLKNELTLDIIDNGKGFNSEISSKGIGLSNINRRAVSILKGKLSIESNSQGTHIKIIIAPLYEKYECTDC